MTNLATEKIGTLIRKFAIPCVISMVVAALYNIVDQIFIGWSSAGANGNAATNIVYPFTVVALAIALLIGDGAAAYFSLSAGANDGKRANNSIGNGITLLVILSMGLTIIGFIFHKQILILFGGNPEETLMWKYALSYYMIICAGLPFYMIGQGLNATIRSDGSPKFAMIATLLGAVSNIILDPIFIFGLNMGVKGAALATIVGQILTFLFSVFYLKRSQSFKISKKTLLLQSNIAKKIIALGLASFVTQLAIVVIITVANNLIAKYGYTTYTSTGEVYGAVIPLAIIGICMKVFGIVVSIVIGVSLGGQPIIGYNMGAGNIERVKETCKKILVTNIIISCIAFLSFQLFPELIIDIFGKGNGIIYIEYAKLCLRIFLGGIVFTCITKTSSILLQSTGSGLKSTLLALARDVFFFVPAIITIAVLSNSVVSMLWSAIIADVLACVLALLLLHLEYRKMQNIFPDKIEEEKTEEMKSILEKRVILTINREYGSGGRYVGKLLANKLGIPVYDKELIELVSKESGYLKEYIEKREEENKIVAMNYYLPDEDIFTMEAKIIRDISKKSCVIVGRCADYILKEDRDLIRIFLYTSDEDKVKRAIQYYGFDERDAFKRIQKINKQRAKYYNLHTNQEWKNPDHYDLMINVDKYGIEETAMLLADYVIKRKYSIGS